MVALTAKNNYQPLYTFFYNNCCLYTYRKSIPMVNFPLIKENVNRKIMKKNVDLIIPLLITFQILQ